MGEDELAESMRGILRDDLAEKFFDEKVLPGLRAEGQGASEIETSRARFVAMVVGARAELADYGRPSEGPILVGYNFDEPNQRYVTKTGKVLSEEELQGYVEEAERGYERSYVQPNQRYRTSFGNVEDPQQTMRWDVSQKFRLTRGEFDLAAESALYAEGVRREMNAGAFRFVSYVEATIDRFALRQARGKLYDLLRPYDVNVFIYDVRIVCLGEPK